MITIFNNILNSGLGDELHTGPAHMTQIQTTQCTYLKCLSENKNIVDTNGQNEEWNNFDDNQCCRYSNIAEETDTCRN